MVHFEDKSAQCLAPMEAAHPQLPSCHCPDLTITVETPNTLGTWGNQRTHSPTSHSYSPRTC